MIKTTWNWYRVRQVGQCNIIKDSEINPHTYGHLIFDKKPKINNGKKKAPSLNGAGLTGSVYIEKWK